MSSQPAPRITRNLKIASTLRRTVVGRTLYNASDLPREFHHSGVPYTIPPDGPWHEHFTERRVGDALLCTPGIVQDKGEHVIYDGTLTVYDRYGVPKEKALAYAKNRKSSRSGPMAPPEADLLIAGADDIVQHAVKKLGDGGVTYFIGYPELTEEDLQAKQQAKEGFIAFKRAQVKRTLENYKKRNAAFHADPQNRGRYAPEMDDHELAAQAWEDEDKLRTKTTKKFHCPMNCGYASNDQSVIDRHVEASHPMLADQTAAEQPPEEEPEEKVAPAKRARR